MTTPTLTAKVTDAVTGQTASKSAAFSVGSGIPTPPSGWTKTYSHDFAHDAGGLADWVVQPGATAQVSVSQAVGAEFGLGIGVTAVNQWAEVISSDAVIGPSCFVQALMYFPLAPNGQVANWPAWWTTAASGWPATGEIDIMECQSGNAALQTHYSSGPTSDVEINSPSSDAPVGTGNWMTVSMLRQNGMVSAWYNSLALAPVPLPPTTNHVLIFQNQSYSTTVCGHCFGPTLLGPASTSYLSNVQVYAPA